MFSKLDDCKKEIDDDLLTPQGKCKSLDDEKEDDDTQDDGETTEEDDTPSEDNDDTPSEPMIPNHPSPHPEMYRKRALVSNATVKLLTKIIKL